MSGMLASWDDAEHVAWVRALCFFAGAPERSLGFIERGATRDEIVQALWQLVHDAPRPRDLAPFPDLFDERSIHQHDDGPT